MLLDKFADDYHINMVHATHVQAPPGRVLTAVKELPASELSPVVHLLFAIRALPEKLFGRQEMRFAGQKIPMLDQMFSSGFVKLAEDPDRELVFGLIVPSNIGRVWQKPDYDLDQITSAQDFVDFDHPNFCKVAGNFYVEAAGRSQVTMSTCSRVQALSPQARKRFAPYWFIIYPGSALIRHLWLNAIKRRAESEGRLG